MKKWKLIVVLTMALTMLMGMNVCAAGSANYDTELSEGYEGAAIVNGESVDVRVDRIHYFVSRDVQDALTEGTVDSLAGAEYEFTVRFCDIWVEDMDGYYVEGATFPDGIILTFEVSYVTSASVVKVLHWNENAWDNTPEVVAIRDGEIDVKFTALSPIAILVAEAPASESASSDDDDDDVEELPPFETPVTVGGTKTVQVGNITAGIQLDRSTKTFYERDAKILFGTDRPCSVYLMDLWLFDPATGGNVPLGSEGAEITLNVPNVNPNCRVVVRHWLNGTDEYEDIIPKEIGNGYIVVKFNTLSPIAIIVEQVEATPGTPATTTASGQVSPKTAEGSMIYVVELLAAVSLLGFVVYRRRSMDR